MQIEINLSLDTKNDEDRELLLALKELLEQYDENILEQDEDA